ncbi:hypothetical protein N431DRAFT_416611 [Stipitochalara longipes BDJ]|nr:hypothetical protein N431DRAFT_416611 [Stipitochalara longipes BDJ]
MGFLSWPYVEGESAWGELDSKWYNCYVTSYIVEFINTTSNLMRWIVYLGIKGILNTKRNSNDSVIVLSHALLAFVGVGSATYHTNVKYWAQIGTLPPHSIKETSMLYATVAILFGVFSITLGKRSRFLLGNILFCFVLSASIAHGYLNHTDMFQLLFATMVVGVFCQCVWLVWTRVKHSHVASEMRWLGIYGTVTFVSGYIVWNIDFAFCAELGAFRAAVGMPLGFVTELHGWWHILTGIGVYYFIVVIEYLRLYTSDPKLADQTDPHIALSWASVLHLPYLQVSPRTGSKVGRQEREE